MKLKNCPFCSFSPDIMDEDCVYPINRERTVWKINCYESGGGCSAHILGDSVEDCIEKWQTRADENRISTETKINVIDQGDVELTNGIGYMVIGNSDVVCFYFDVRDRANVCATTTSENDCPVAILSDGDEVSALTEIEFVDFPKYRIHGAFGGKTISISLVRRGAE